jgi:flavin reductase (DIM6/NTAB) family NADH-FMN oxidoreductase RutF
MILNLNNLDRVSRYKLLIGAVVPRPIAWVSSIDSDGRLNLAPFSYFNGVCTIPLTLVFCPGVHPDGRKKDTWRNIEAVPEFVINITNEETAEAMNRTATLLPSGQSEFEWAGVTPVPSETIRVPRVAEAPIAFECKLQQIVVISEAVGGGAAVFGEVQCIHVRDDVYENGRILPDKLRPIGRMAGAGYTRAASDMFEMFRVSPPEVDNLLL